MKTIVLTGGGTAGHVMPALALVPYLRPYFSHICYAGRLGGVEERLATQAGLPFFGTQTIQFDRRRLWRNAAIPYVLHKATAEVAEWLSQIKCDIVFSKGGYCALPTVLAANRLRIPIVCHESDRTIGLANRLSLRYTNHFITSFDTTPRGVYMGNPIRDGILQGSPHAVPLPLDARPVVLVMGGSGGALVLNRAAAALAEALPTWQVVNLYGKSPVDCSAPNYYGVAFTDQIADFYARADVVVCRAGANTLSELAAVGRPVVMVPLPRGVSRGDQVDNAAYYASRYGFIHLPQQALTTERLRDAVLKAHLATPTVSSVDLRAQGNACARIAQYIHEVECGAPR